jgi:hypothetical protein
MRKRKTMRMRVMKVMMMMMKEKTSHMIPMSTSMDPLTGTWGTRSRPARSTASATYRGVQIRIHMGRTLQEGVAEEQE